MVEDYVYFEERKVFSHIENKFSEEQLESVGKQLKSLQHAAFRDVFEDEFRTGK